MPPLQFALQHSAEFEHAWLSDVHVELPHVPPLQTKVQQSSGVVHALPAAMQPPSEPPVPPTVEPPVPVFEPPVPVFEPPVLVPVKPPAPPEFPPAPVDPTVSAGVLASPPPQVTSTTVANNVTTPATNIRWIM